MEVLSLVSAFLPLRDQISLMKVSKALYQVSWRTIDTLVLPKKFCTGGGEYIGEEKFRPPMPDFYSMPMPYNCFAKNCSFFGSEDHFGFCSRCVVLTSVYNPSEKTLSQWREKGENDPKNKKKREECVVAWKADVHRRIDIFAIAHQITNFLSKLQILRSLIIDHPFTYFLQGAANPLRPFPLSFKFFQQKFSLQLKCVFLPCLDIDERIVDMFATEFINLSHLDISQSFFTKNISTSALLSLCRLPKLEHLNLSGYSIDNVRKFYSEFPKMHQLRSLALGECKLYARDEDIKIKDVVGKNLGEWLHEKVPNLEALDIRNGCFITRMFEEIKFAIHLPHLRVLDLRRATSSDKIDALKAPQIEVLILDYERDDSNKEANPDIKVYVLAENYAYRSMIQYFIRFCPFCYAEMNHTCPVAPHPIKGKRFK